MTTTDVQTDGTAEAGVGSSAVGLEIELFPNGRTKTIRLSGCTFGDAVNFCAPGLWQEYATELERELASPGARALRQDSIDTVELLLYEDGSVQEIRLRGCTAEHARVFGQLIEPVPPNVGHAIELIQHTTAQRPDQEDEDR
jgi:hypothetical protein